MTTEAAANLYLEQHLFDQQGRKRAIHNPHNKPTIELPIVYGFNNGGGRYMWQAIAMAQDGTVLGSHCCSNELYMPSDIGMLEGNEYRAKSFTKHYPDGWRVEFVGINGVPTHEGLKVAFALNKAYAELMKNQGESSEV